MVVYGHTPVPEPEWLNRTINIDTGCVFGGKLTALRYPERELVSVPARADLLRAGQALPGRARERAAAHGAAAARRRARHRRRARASGSSRRGCAGNVTDPRGERHGRAGGDEPLRRQSQVADLPAADDVAVRDQRRAEACWSTRPRRSPTSARTACPQVVCEEKHMGSRAVVVVCRDEDAARQRFGVDRRGDAASSTPAPAGASSTTRRSRRSSSPASATALDARRLLGGARDRLGLPRLRADALVGQGARHFIREQYAPPAPRPRLCGRAPAVAGPRSEPRQRGVDAGRACSNATGRSTMAAALSPPPTGTTAGRSASLDDLKLAPFHLLATEGHVALGQDHVWHMDDAGEARCRDDPAAAGDAASRWST